MAEPIGPDPVFGAAAREMSRAHIADIWQRGQKDEPLSDEEQVFYRVMCEHPEYSEIWQHAAELAERDVQVGGTNPFLHVALHSVIERQILAHTPPEADQAVFRLTRAGLARHEATHRLAGLLAEVLWDTVHRGKPFDEATYRRRLRALKP